MYGLVRCEASSYAPSACIPCGHCEALLRQDAWVALPFSHGYLWLCTWTEAPGYGSGLIVPDQDVLGNAVRLHQTTQHWHIGSTREHAESVYASCQVYASHVD